MTAIEPAQFTTVTPSGIEVLYQAAPKRLYRVRVSPKHITWNGGEPPWLEVPSVTTVLGCLDKPALPWWGMTVGVNGVLELMLDKHLYHANDDTFWVEPEREIKIESPQDVVELLTKHRKTVNHIRDKAGDRGNSIHAALEDWANTGTLPHPEIYPKEEKGYIEGLRKFIIDFSEGDEGPRCTDVEAEVMVGSLAHGYAGRYDLRCYFHGGPLVTRVYPKRANKVEEIPAGKYLLDLKTSSGVYPSHMLQLEAYEGASVECGYEPTDMRAVVHVTADGRYEFVRSKATLQDFLSVRRCYQVMQDISSR